MSSTLIWIPVPHPGIGAPLTDAVPFEHGRVTAISRRSWPRTEHLKAGLADPRSWRYVAREFDVDLAQRTARSFRAPGRRSEGRMGRLPIWANIHAVLLNSAAPQVLGKAFVQACRHHAVIRNGCALLLPCRRQHASRHVLIWLGESCHRPTG